MGNFTGANINDITKLRQSDVFLKVGTTVVGTVTVPDTLSAGDALRLGTLLNSKDGGLTWNVAPATYEAGSFNTNEEVYLDGHVFKSTADNNTEAPATLTNWEDLGVWDANGILYNDLLETAKTTVVVTADLKTKNLTGFDEFLRPQLFKNKLFTK